VKQTIERASQDAKDSEGEHRLLMPDGSVKLLKLATTVPGFTQMRIAWSGTPKIWARSTNG
jgi:hypothetical protein